MYFPDRGCVHTLLTLFVYATVSSTKTSICAVCKCKVVFRKSNNFFCCTCFTLHVRAFFSRFPACFLQYSQIPDCIQGCSQPSSSCSLIVFRFLNVLLISFYSFRVREQNIVRRDFFTRFVADRRWSVRWCITGMAGSHFDGGSILLLAPHLWAGSGSRPMED